MKTLEIRQMEDLQGGGWGMLICKVVLVGTGAALGGPGGALAGAIAGNILCMSTPAY